MLRAGDLLVGPYPPGSGKLRRFLIVSDEIAEVDPKVAWVYVSTSMSDPTVVLAKGCHVEITQDCCVVFEQAEVVDVVAIQMAITAQALALAATPLPSNLVSQIQEGIFDSEDTPIRVVKFCTDRT